MQVVINCKGCLRWIEFFYPTVVIYSLRKVVELMAHVVDSNCRFLAADVRLQLMLGGTIIPELVFCFRQ